MFTWNDAKQVLILPNMLSSKAERVYEAISVDDKKDLAKVCESLVTGCSQTKEVLLQQFYSRKPVRGEQTSKLEKIRVSSSSPSLLTGTRTRT